MGGQPAPPVLLVGADALVARRRTAAHDAQVSDEYAVRVEGAEPCPHVPLGERTSRLRQPLRESLKGLRIVLVRSVVLGHGPGHGLRPVFAAEAAHRVSLGKRRLPGQGACRQHVVQLQIESVRDPGILVVWHPDQTDRDPGRFRKGRLECLHPPVGVAHGVLVRDEHHVAPVVVGVERGADEQMVPAVLNGGAGVLEDCQGGGPTGREVAHGATLPDEACPHAWLLCAHG